MNTERELNYSNLDQQTTILEYEIIIGELTNELDNVKKEHSILKSKITSLVEENNNLSKQYNDLLVEKINVDHKENDITQNLQQQIHFLTKEKESSTKLWQNAVKTIDSLEQDLRIYQSGVDGFVPKKDVSKLKHSYDERIRHLSSELSFAKEKLQEMSKSNSNTLVAKFSEFDKSLEVQENSFKIIHNLEQEILSLQQRLQEFGDVRQKLEKKLKDQEKEVSTVQKKNEVCVEKVKESLRVVEAALIEKDAALMREKELKDKIVELNNNLSDQIKQSDDKLINEISRLKEQYEEKLRDTEKAMRVIEDELRMKTFEMQKYVEKCELLDHEIERFTKGTIHLDENSTSKLLVLEKNLEATFQKLLISEKQNVSLQAQADAIKNDMDEMSRHFERDIKNRDIEKVGLQQRIKQLQAELDEATSKSVKESDKIEMLQHKMMNMEKEFNENLENKERYLKNVHTTEISELKQGFKEKIEALTSQLERQRDLNDKWRIECNNITENLERLIRDLKNEMYRVKKENKKLTKRLKEQDRRANEYKSFLQILSEDVTKISEKAIIEKDT